MKFLANENFPIASVELLRDTGYDIIAIGDEYPGVSDEYVMNLAEKEQRVILTFDRDYGELVFRHNYKPTEGIIYLRLLSFEPFEPGMAIQKLFQEYGIDTTRKLTVFDGLMVRQRSY